MPYTRFCGIKKKDEPPQKQKKVSILFATGVSTTCVSHHNAEIETSTTVCYELFLYYVKQLHLCLYTKRNVKIFLGAYFLNIIPLLSPKIIA